MAGPNPYFDLYDNTSEQNLLDSLVQEQVELWGEGMYYIPRRPYNYDPLYVEDDQDYFDKTYLTTFYIKNVDGFEGQGHFMSKFGLEIRDQITLSVSQTIFMQDVGRVENFVRPREGDLIYFPKNDKVFEIVFVNKFSMFYPLGSTPSYDITCQLYEYSGQHFRTGIRSVDKIEALSEDLYHNALLTEDGSVLLMETGEVFTLETYSEAAIDPMDQSTFIQNEANNIMDFSETDPFSEGPY